LGWGLLIGHFQSGNASGQTGVTDPMPGFFDGGGFGEAAG
jgi:hypothetical protein